MLYIAEGLGAQRRCDPLSRSREDSGLVDKTFEKCLVLETSLIWIDICFPYPLRQTVKVYLASIFHMIYFPILSVYKKMVNYELAFVSIYIIYREMICY